MVVCSEGTSLIVDSRYVTAARTIARERPGMVVYQATGSLDDAIVKVLDESGARGVGVEAAHLSVARYHRWAELLERRLDLIPTERFVEKLRAVKDQAELAIMRSAGDRISAVASGLRRLVVPGRTERQVAAAIDAAMRDAGFDGPAFETIVASGRNAALPHARPTDRPIHEGEGVLLDFGGAYDGYCVDLTRTLHVGPEAPAFRRLFEAVAEAHRAALAAVKPGALAVDIDGAARQALAGRGLGDTFGHGTGHGLGLEVHEEPRISPLAPPDEPVVAGMVFTIEPGAYLPDVGGVRIEDDVLVTDEGAELLTRVPIQL